MISVARWYGSKATTGDPDAAEVVRVGNERQAESYREVIRIIAAKPGGLKVGLDEDTATDVLLALFSSDVYAALANRNWTRDRCLAFFRTLLADHMLGERLDQ